jgi:hypothetical protein
MMRFSSPTSLRTFGIGFCLLALLACKKTPDPTPIPQFQFEPTGYAFPDLPAERGLTYLEELLNYDQTQPGPFTQARLDTAELEILLRWNSQENRYDLLGTELQATFDSLQRWAGQYVSRLKLPTEDAPHLQIIDVDLSGLPTTRGAAEARIPVRTTLMAALNPEINSRCDYSDDDHWLIDLHGCPPNPVRFTDVGAPEQIEQRLNDPFCYPRSLCTWFGNVSIQTYDPHHDHPVPYDMTHAEDDVPHDGVRDRLLFYVPLDGSVPVQACLGPDELAFYQANARNLSQGYAPANSQIAGYDLQGGMMVSNSPNPQTAYYALVMSVFYADCGAANGPTP